MAERAGWQSRSGFVLATIGSAVGIGSIWKFPYEVGANGGGAFVLAYVVGLVVVVVPLLLAELVIGRRGRADAAASIERVARDAGAGRRWSGLGVLGATTAFLVLSFYAVIGGWAISFALETLWSGLPSGSDEVTARFDALLASPGRMAAASAAFLAVVGLIVGRGVERGIERSMKVLMPLLVALVAALAVWSLRTGDAAAALRFLFRPDIGELGAAGVLDALGLGFFSIGVGLGIMVTYGSYSDGSVRLRTVALASVAGDTVVSVLAGLAIFPVVFANDLDPAGGAGLAFVSLPMAFDAMPGGRWAALAFFTMLAVAAIGSAVSMLECVVAVVGRRTGWRRSTATVASGAACFVAGLATVLSFNRWADVRPLGWVARYADATIFDLLDDLTSQLLLPLGGLGFAVLVGWVLPASVLGDGLGVGARELRLLRVALRYVAPVLVVAAAALAVAG